MSNNYRKSALEKLQSPEQLDKMIEITSPMFWIASLGGGLIIVAALIWSICARLPVNVSSDGIFIGKGGIGTVYCADYGIIDEVLDVDFTKGSSHKDRLRDKLFSADAGDELDFDDLANVQAAVRSYDGIRKT